MAPSARHVAAVDLGAGSGRVVLGRVGAERAEIEVVHRFENRPLTLPDGLHWNLPQLFEETLRGLSAAASVAGERLESIGVDSWGCDYALLDGSGRMVGLPYHYRDRRTGGDVLARTYDLVSRGELYRRTGIQEMPINTLFQLRAEAQGAAASVAERIALIPDLLGLWLTGHLANELTAASTTGLLDATTGAWAVDLIGRLRLPLRPFSGEVVTPGFALGPVLDAHQGAAGTPVHAVAGHDTACAFAATPLTGAASAILSSGTWSLLGVELEEPQLGPEAAAANLTNERGVGGTIRLLRNVMGLWLVDECRRAWSAAGDPPSLEELMALAEPPGGDVPLFDPDDGSLLRSGADMPERIAALCVAGGQAAAQDRGELIRAILYSLACKYRLVLEQLEGVTERRLEVIHVVGGGARNDLLCQLTADLCQREVLAGPVEATALGNVLVQAMALGELANLREVRDVARRSATLRRFEPTRRESAEATFQRFLEVTRVETAQTMRTTA